ncbi:Hexose carrier protein HEX6 [Linum perenne]
MLTVDKNERRKLFFIDGVQMFVSQILVVGIMVTELGDHNGIGKQYAMVVIVRIINYVARFGLSWGPLGWLVPSEIFSMEIRSTGAEYCGGGEFSVHVCGGVVVFGDVVSS